MSVDLIMLYKETDTPAMARTSNLNEELGQVSLDLIMFYKETDTPAMARTSNLNEELGQGVCRFNHVLQGNRYSSCG